MIDPADLAPREATNAYCMLVNSCDAYADCWEPFFKLLTCYWPQPIPVTYLNTETQAFGYPNIEIRCPRVGLGTRRPLPWGERLLRTLDRIPHEIVLYMQEDYFIRDPVDVAMLESLVKLMQRDRISHVSLHDGGRARTRTEHKFLDRIDQRAEYRISTQAGLWRIPALRSYLRNHETVWEFEWYGTRRARRRREAFLCVNTEYEAVRGTTVVPYRGTGVVHGRWARNVVEGLFADHEISVDYAARGFFDPANDQWQRSPGPVRALRRLRSVL